MAIVHRFAASRTPGAFLTMAWDVFFASRGRGVSLDAHFPWLAGGGRDDRAFCIEQDGHPAAMLMVREGILGGPDGGLRFHAIGLVCTAPAFRQRGLAGRLMDAALEDVGRLPVLLWTSQHGFYERWGFEVADPTLVVACRMSPASSHSPEQSDWPGGDTSFLFGGPRGLPSFVRRAARVGAGRPDVAEAGGAGASLVVSEGNDVPVVLSLDGPAPAVADLVASLGARELVLNLPRPGPVLEELRVRGASLALQPTNIAMWRFPDADASAITHWDVPLLDRF